MKQQGIKAWAVVFPRWIGEAKYFSGEGYAHQARIYATKKRAQENWTNEPIVPVEIHILPPKPLKTKPKK